MTIKKIMNLMILILFVLPAVFAVDNIDTLNIGNANDPWQIGHNVYGLYIKRHLSDSSFVIDSPGNVGIGNVPTTGYKLDVYGDILAQGNVDTFQLKATNKIISPKLCIGTDCRTAWPSISSGNFALINHNHDARYINTDGDTLNGVLSFNNANTQILKGTGNSLKIKTNSGYVEIGPQNSGWSHFYTDRANFYFNKGVQTSGIFKIYNANTYLSASEGKIAGNLIWHGGNFNPNTKLDYNAKAVDSDKLDGFDSGHFLPSSSYTSADVLSKLKTVDGSNSDLDADKLDGLNSLQFLRSDVDTTLNGGLTVTGLLNSSSKITTPELCLNGECKSSWYDVLGDSTSQLSKVCKTYQRSTGETCETHNIVLIDEVMAQDKLTSPIKQSFRIQKSDFTVSSLGDNSLGQQIPSSCAHESYYNYYFNGHYRKDSEGNFIGHNPIYKINLYSKKNPYSGAWGTRTLIQSIPIYPIVSAQCGYKGCFEKFSTNGRAQHVSFINIQDSRYGGIEVEVEPLVTNGQAKLEITYDDCKQTMENYDVCHSELNSDLIVNDSVNIKKSLNVKGTNNKIDNNLNVGGTLVVGGQATMQTLKLNNELCLAGVCKKQWMPEGKIGNEWSFVESSANKNINLHFYENKEITGRDGQTPEVIFDNAVKTTKLSADQLCMGGKCTTDLFNPTMCYDKTFTLDFRHNLINTDSTKYQSELVVDTTKWTKVSIYRLDDGWAAAHPNLYIDDKPITGLSSYDWVDFNDLNSILTKSTKSKFKMEANKVGGNELGYDFRIKYTECVPVKEAYDELQQQVDTLKSDNSDSTCINDSGSIIISSTAGYAQSKSIDTRNWVSAKITSSGYMNQAHTNEFTKFVFGANQYYVGITRSCPYNYPGYTCTRIDTLPSNSFGSNVGQVTFAGYSSSHAGGSATIEYKEKICFASQDAFNQYIYDQLKK